MPTQKIIKKAVFAKSPLKEWSPEESSKLTKLSPDEIFQRIDQIPKKLLGLNAKVDLLKQIIVDSFLKDESGNYNVEQLFSFFVRLKTTKPEIAVKVLTDLLKLIQQDRHFQLSEKNKDARQDVQKAPIVIFNNTGIFSSNNQPPQTIIDVLPESRPTLNLEEVPEEKTELVAPLGFETEFEKVREKLKLNNLSIKPLSEQAIENLAEIEAMSMNEEIQKKHTVLDGKLF